MYVVSSPDNEFQKAWSGSVCFHPWRPSTYCSDWSRKATCAKGMVTEQPLVALVEIISGKGFFVIL